HRPKSHPRRRRRSHRRACCPARQPARPASRSQETEGSPPPGLESYSPPNTGPVRMIPYSGPRQQARVFAEVSAQAPALDNASLPSRRRRRRLAFAHDRELGRGPEHHLTTPYLPARIGGTDGLKRRAPVDAARPREPGDGRVAGQDLLAEDMRI